MKRKAGRNVKQEEKRKG